MGRRRERRQATGRRTKLDLFADDTPELGGENAHTGEIQDEHTNNTERAAAPPSNHSGVQENNNPLSLLGQYSDDEEDAGNKLAENPAPVKIEDKKLDAKVADFIAELETSGLLDSSETIQEQETKSEAPETKKNERSKPREVSSVQRENGGGSMATMIGDVVQKVIAEKEVENSEWRAVLHEESGEYFYWNVLTGATTWEKPGGGGGGGGLVELGAGYSPPPVPASEAAPSYKDEALVSYVPAGELPGFQSAEVTDPAMLIQLAETIYTRFKVLSGESLLLVPLRARLAIEAELRLSDCRLLASQGCSSGAFWSLTEAHMKRLDSLLAVEEAALLREMEQKPPGDADEDVDMEVDMDIEPETETQAAPPLPPDDPPPPPEPEVPPLPQEEPSALTGIEPVGEANNTASSSASSSAPANSSDGGAASVAAAILEAAAAAKKSVSRVKKGNASLSTGKVTKKVSSLVNKWIAAKEELHESGDEEEDKTLYNPQAQERKRQKELEDWRREQIASGQALENANFQPLGPVDWRQRVKRAKISENSKISTYGVQQPDLELLSKGLAPGWKAYWDESSKDVYYGNLSTSETTWDRPVG